MFHKKNNFYRLKRNWPQFRLPKFCPNRVYVPYNVWNTYVWKLPVKESGYCKVAGYTNSFLKNQLVHWNFWSIYFRVKLSKDLFCWKLLSGCFRCFIYLCFGDTSNFFMRLQQIQMKFQIVAISWKKIECPRVFFFCCATFFYQKICFSNKKNFKSIWNKQIFWEKREFVKKVN